LYQVEQYAQAILTVLSLINPVICGAMFARAAGGESRSRQLGDATRAALAIMVILSGAAIAGARLLAVFGISLNAFQVAGGMVLVWMGFLMLRGTSSPTASEKPAGTEVSLTPVILFGASPGTITGVITLSVAHAGDGVPVTTLAAIVIALTVTWLVMILAAGSSGKKKQGLVHDVTSRFMGLLVLAMGVQFALSGLKAFLTS
jgi:multiple antibiotic resistance protein